MSKDTEGGRADRDVFEAPAGAHAWLSRYRRRNLLLSWIPFGGTTLGDAFGRMFADVVEDEMAKSLGPWVRRRLSGAKDLQVEPVVRLVELLSKTVAETGLEGLCDWLWAGGPVDAGGPDALNVLPAEDDGAACAPVTVAVSREDGGKAWKLASILREIQRHLVHCLGTARVVVLLTDAWSPSAYAGHAATFEAWQERGVTLLALVASRRGLSPVEA
jgi:hypothetical protein